MESEGGGGEGSDASVSRRAAALTTSVSLRSTIELPVRVEEDLEELLPSMGSSFAVVVSRTFVEEEEEEGRPFDSLGSASRLGDGVGESR